MSAYACRVDVSKETGSLVVCTCGFVLGPFMNRDRALEVARDHRRIHAEPYVPSPSDRARYAVAQREKRAAARKAR